MEHVEKTNFPWLMSNVVDNETGRPLAEGKVTHMLDWWGRKIGLVSESIINAFMYLPQYEYQGWIEEEFLDIQHGIMRKIRWMQLRKCDPSDASP